MQQHLKPGSVFLPLLLALSLSGLFLVKNVAVKSFAAYQDEVSQSVDNGLDLTSPRYTLSDFLGSVSSWQSYTSDKYYYQIKYPAVWHPDLNIQKTQETLNNFGASLDNKIKLSVNVVKTLHISEKVRKSKFGENSFYFYEDGALRKSAATNHNDLYYQIQLTQDNYFGTPQEFKAAFFQILKNFRFVG